MGWKTASESWEWLARRDPLWAILTRSDKRGGKWGLDEFFATGRAEIDAVFARLAARGIAAPEGGFALDFGCGVGRVTRALAARFTEAHGVDASPTMIERARELHALGQSGARFFLNVAADLRAFESEAYSFVYSSIVLQHIPYPASRVYVEEFLRLVRPGGLAVFQVPTEDLTPLPLKAARLGIRTVVQRLKLPIPALHMEMSVLPRGEIEAIAGRGGARIEDWAYTNAHEGEASGRLTYSEAPPPGRLRSMQFVLRKSEP
jgi:SAM-dependent methyltransferase